MLTQESTLHSLRTVTDSQCFSLTGQNYVKEFENKEMFKPSTKHKEKVH
jgi:hypothetical protein